MLRLLLALGQIAGLVTGAAQGPLLDLADAFRQRTGQEVTLQFDTSPNISRRLTSGETPDVLVASTAAIDDLVRSGKAIASTRVALGKIGIGVGISAGWKAKGSAERQPPPDVSSVESLKAALLQADAIVYTMGASGGYSAQLIADLGIADQVKNRTVQVPTGAALMERLGASGGREIGMTMISEIRFGERHGGMFVGPLPRAVQSYTSYDAVVMATARAPDVAAEFLRTVTAPAGQQLFTESGWVRNDTTFDWSALEAVARRELAETRTPGAAVAVILGDRVIYSRGFGVASVETREPLRPEMLFRLGSTTKMFTATALVSLAEKGAIDLQKPVGTFIQGLHPSIARLTGHQLLSHTSGLFDEAPMFGSSDDAALEKEVRSWNETRFFTEPGRIYSYSNPGFWMAGFLIQAMSGKSYADQMEASVFKPLGMSRTTLRPMVAMTYSLAQGHDESSDGPKVVRPAANNTASWPAGSIYSNVIDLSRFIIAFINDGKIDGTQILSPTLITSLSTGYAKIPGGDSMYGYGLQMSKSRGVNVVSHGGSRSGYGSTIRMVPQRHFGVVVLANRTGISMSDTADKAMEIVLALEPAKPTPRPATMIMTAAEMSEYAGTYSQGPRTIKIVARDGKLFLDQQGRESALVRSGTDELRSGADSRFVVVRGTTGKVEYLHGGGRSWRKTD